MIKTGKKMTKMRKTKIEEMKTDRFLMEQQGKTMDGTSQYHHCYRCNRPRR